MTTLPADAAQFHNRLRILMNIEAEDFANAGLTFKQWRDFDANPHRFFIRADDPTAAAIWRIVEAREAKRTA